jgi:putative aldouronate transport system permease protein
VTTMNKHNMPLTRRSMWVRMQENWQLYVLLLPAIAYLLLFAYGPMFGITIAFKDFRPHKGIFGSNWVGLKHFERFLRLNKFQLALRNTITLSLYSLVAGFPLPILLALLLNSSPYLKLKKTVQTVTYAPHFISIVVIVGMIRVFFSPTTGLVGNVLRSLGLLDGSLMVLTDPKAFSHLYVWSGVWQGMGWSSIIYLGALTGVDPALHESALIDGANKLQRIRYIDLPSIAPTIVILLILNSGSIMNVGFEKVFLLQNSLNISASETIATYVYKVGIQDAQYSFSTAINLFNSVINFTLLVIVNLISRSLGESSLW